MATTTVTQTAERSECIELGPVADPSVDAAEPPVSKKQHTAYAQWKLSNDVYIKVISAGFSFFVAGANDGSIGALLPYIIREYNINTAIVSAIYGANFLGWLLSAVVNTHLCQYLDLGAMLCLGAALQILAHALRSWGPPFGLFVVTFWLVSTGQAFQDTHANTFVAGLGAKSHRWLAFIHSMYMAGCLLAPFISTAVASAGGGGAQSRWYLYYTFPLAIGVANLAFAMVAFKDTVRLHKKRSPEQDSATGSSDQNTSDNQPFNATASRNQGAMVLIRATLSTRSVWLLCIFFLFYLGSTLTIGGWIVEFLYEARHGVLSKVGYVPAGFSGGCLLGRLLLAEPTHRFGERRMVFIYCVLALALQLVFWLVPDIIAASIAVSFIGFFTGPLFATGISLGSRLFPEEIRSTALALVFLFAQMGGALFPIITGVLSSNTGVKVLQPILVGLLVATGISWLLVPQPKSVANNSGLHQE